MQFEPKSFTWKEDGKKQVGWIAQEGMEVIPEMFPFIEKIDRYGMDEFNILPYFHKAIRQQYGQVKIVKTKVEKLEQKVKQLESKVKVLEDATK